VECLNGIFSPENFKVVQMKDREIYLAKPGLKKFEELNNAIE
tara:strand:+ start:143325 stop:143450 length:126 start_codon:yes stop_codon:yes gene_type:complete